MKGTQIQCGKRKNDMYKRVSIVRSLPTWFLPVPSRYDVCWLNLEYNWPVAYARPMCCTKIITDKLMTVELKASFRLKTINNVLSS